MSLRLRLRYAVALMLSEPAIVIISIFLSRSKTHWPCETQSQLLPIPALITLHSILVVTLSATSWHLPSTFLVTKNTLRSVAQDDTFDTNDTKLHSSPSSQHMFVHNKSKRYHRPRLNELPIPNTLDWTALPQKLFVVGMHCAVTGPGNDTEHWTKPCPWAVGSSSSRGWTREPSGCEGTGIREAAINLPSAAAGSRLRHTVLPKLHFALVASPALADSLLLLFKMFCTLLCVCFFLRSVLLPSLFSLCVSLFYTFIIFFWLYFLWCFLIYCTHTYVIFFVCSPSVRNFLRFLSYPFLVYLFLF